MLKYLIVLMVVGHLSLAQKSFYAGQQSLYPKVLAKYRTTTTAAAAAAAASTSTTPLSLNNRVGENTEVVPTTDSSATPFNQENDFQRFIQRISSWPVDKQPFWYRNREAIWAMINQQVDNSQQPSGTINNPRSPFAGRG